MTNLDTTRLNRNARVAGAVLAALLASPAAMATAKAKTQAPAPAQEPAATSQDPLLNTLLKNGVINKQQYADLAKSGQNFADNALLQVLAQNGKLFLAFREIEQDLGLQTRVNVLRKIERACVIVHRRHDTE